MLLKFAKALKLGKVGLAGASLFAYTYLFTWEFAAMIMVMLFVHESGHIWAMKRCGMKTRGIYFIPFLGGVAVGDGEFPSRKAEVIVAIMGPVWGLLLSLASAAAFLFTQNPLFAAGASWMALVNLFNLLPINPLDGGRIVKSVAYSVHSKLGIAFLLLGVLAAGLLTFKVGLGLFYFLLVVGMLDLLSEWKNRAQRPPMSSREILWSLVFYILAIAVLFGLMVYMKDAPGASVAMELLEG